jgi:phosphatidate cytidylyltransferase
MVCERHGFNLEYWPTCEPNSIFSYIPLSELVGDQLASALPSSLLSIMVQPMDEHVLWMSIFASFVAPFGGFFASGFKRAFKIKDFGDSIPGHGGITDRMDCQILMGFFAYVYYTARVSKQVSSDVDIDVVLRILMELSADQMLEIYGRLGEGLMQNGILK